MQQFCIWSVAFWIALSSQAFSNEERTYWPGFTGTISYIGGPLDARSVKDRYVAMTIALDAKPKAQEVVFDSAYHAVCKRHRPELLKMARSFSAQNDWRVKVSFRWPASPDSGDLIAVLRSKMMFLSNCRAAG